jgi:WD40 repeat protein
MTFILAIVFVVAVFAPACVWASGSGGASVAVSGAAGAAASDDDDDDAPPLMVMADFNRDGIADIAEITVPVGNHSGAGDLTVSLGQPDGTFKKTASSAVLGHAPRSIVSGDFNRDGMQDVIVGDDDGSLKLFLGDGTGKLTAAGDAAHLDSVVSMAVADFNRDGIPDMVVSDWRKSAVTVLLGAGDGTFRIEVSFPLRMAGTTPHVSVADFNGDGIPDVAITYGDDDGYTYEVLLGNGKGFFTFAPNLSVIKDANAHCVT